MEFSMQAIGEYKLTEQASALKQRDYKDATDLIIGGGYCDGNSSKTAYSNGVFKTSGLS